MCLIKGAFVGEKNFERYQNARYDNKKENKTKFFIFNPLKSMYFPQHSIFTTAISITRNEKTQIAKIQALKLIY
jgi:hypothetical protein